MKNISIIGAGPGGLTAGIILAHNGYNVTIFEKDNIVGGRNGYIEKDGFKFDIGPTFLIYRQILDGIFEMVGEDINEYLKFIQLDPMYNLSFKSQDITMSSNPNNMREMLSKKFPEEIEGYNRFLEYEKKRFDVALPCLEKDYSGFLKLFNKNILKFLPKLSFPNSMYDELGKYFKNEDLKMAFTFQSKYLGMSPWSCPAAFMIIPYMEHKYGVYHVQGGLSEISKAMETIFIKKGGIIKFNSTVTKISDGEIQVEGGKSFKFDKIIINADVGYAMKKLVGNNKLENKKYSCSTFMIYLGLNKKIDSHFHTIYFSDNYKKFIDSIFLEKILIDDISFYLRNASLLDSTLAPKGMSNLYILVPVPNNKSKIDWNKLKNEYRNIIINKLQNKLGTNISNHITSETIITPFDWEHNYNINYGATFNLAHSYDQMLYFRPHNKINNWLYLVGGGTHPGSGLPTIYESGKITANMIINNL